MGRRTDTAARRQGGRAQAGTKTNWGRRVHALRALGPGLVAGASDNDPTTVATVAVVGSTTVYALGWVALLIFPMLAAVQAIAARVGKVTERGLGQLVLRRWGSRASWLLVTSVVAVVLITVFLEFVALALLAYVVSAFAAHPNWSAVLHSSLIPSWRWNRYYTQGALALLGTTLTSYVYVWETIELSEDSRRRTVREAQSDAVIGAFFVVAVFWFILVATGATLGVHHHQVQTTEEAAAALRPAAGAAASAVFSIGLLASALLAVPVLIATGAHLISTQRNWRQGLDHPPRRAVAFYATMTVTLALAVVTSFLGVSPIHILFAASIAGGIGTPVSLVFLLLVARDRPLLGQGRASRPLAVAGWIVAVVVTVFAAASLLAG